MALREDNNQNNELAIMETLKRVLPPNTGLASSERVFVQERYEMYKALSTTIARAVHLSAGEQVYQRRGSSMFDGELLIIVSYYGRWDNDPQTIDTVWKEISLDLRRMKSNVEDNDATSYQGTNNTLSLSRIALSPYEGERYEEIPGMTLVFRQMLLHYNLLPYGVGGVYG